MDIQLSIVGYRNPEIINYRFSPQDSPRADDDVDNAAGDEERAAEENDKVYGSI